MVKLDPTNDFHARAAERLKTEAVGWLVTVDADGAPVASPVWFLWDGADSLLIYSQNKPKIRNITANPRVAFHFNDDNGGDVVSFSGTAVFDDAHVKLIDDAAYLAKYSDAIVRIGSTAESFSASYENAVIVTLEKLRGH